MVLQTALRTRPAGIALLVVLLVAGLIARLGVLDVPGHTGDVRVMARWAEEMAAVGPWSFYAHDTSVYPALLYVLWPLGLLLDGPTLEAAIKGLSIPFDLALAVALFTLTRRYAGAAAGFGAAALYLLNPATLLAGPIWGQLDAAGALVFLGALVAASGRRHALAGGLAVLAGLVKPQFGLVALAVATVVVIRAIRAGRWMPVSETVAGAVIAYVTVGLPLLLDPLRYAGILFSTADRQPMTSLNAFNPWGLLIGFSVPDKPYVWIGALLLACGVIASLTPLRRRRDLATVLAVGALLILAFYFLPTRVHERYLLPILALLAPFAATALRFLIPYLVLSTAYALSLTYALAATTSFPLPPALKPVLLTTPAVWLIGVAMLLSAAAFVLLLLSPGRRLRLEEAAVD